VVYIYISELTS